MHQFLLVMLLEVCAFCVFLFVRLTVWTGEIVTSFPFSNAVVDLKFTGVELWDMFEGML